jgi:hypothetical protein
VSKNKNSKTLWLAIFIFSALFLFVETLFPTDQIEKTNFFSNKLTISGIVHLSSLALFFILAPLGIYNLSKTMKLEPNFCKYVNFTRIVGYTMSILCFIWSYFLLSGTFISILGIFQKVIVLVGIYWFSVLQWSIRDDVLD